MEKVFNARMVECHTDNRRFPIYPRTEQVHHWHSMCWNDDGDELDFRFTTRGKGLSLDKKYKVTVKFEEIKK